MPYQVSTRNIEALRATLAQVEQQTDLAPDDPSVVTLKSIFIISMTPATWARVTLSMRSSAASIREFARSKPSFASHRIAPR
jgi:hypothetical protein